MDRNIIDDMDLILNYEYLNYNYGLQFLFQILWRTKAVSFIQNMNESK